MTDEPTHDSKPKVKQPKLRYSQTPSEIEGVRARGWVTLKDFATIAEVSYHTILHWARMEMIKTFPAGGAMRVYEEEIARFLRYGTLPGNPEKLAKLKAKRKGYASNAQSRRQAKRIHDKF